MVHYTAVNFNFVLNIKVRMDVNIMMKNVELKCYV